jgi:hypothetical protein
MAIKVTRNDAGNCITFVGSTNPVYWNSCLEGEINESNSNNINVVNKIRTVEEGTVIYEFFNLPYTDFQDRDGNDFVSPSDCAQYITDNANVLSNTGTFVFSQTDVLDAQRDATDTTVLFSNGDIYAVNSLHASSQADGTIKISTVRGSKDIYTHLRYYNVSVLDGVVSGFNTIDAAVDRLNEVLGGTTVGSNTGNTQTTVTTTDSTATFTVYGDRITETGSGATLGFTSTAEAGNFDTSNGFYSNETISENGEYFEFEQDGGDWTNSRGVYIGLFDETTYDVADLDADVAGNEVKGLLYLRLYPSAFTFADATNGAGKINEAGFSNSPQTKTKFRLGRDNDGRVYIAHETSANVFEVICRSENVVSAGTELRFFGVMPLANELNGVRNMTVNEAVLGASATWYYVESPDTEFYYPLFSNEADAIMIDELYGTAASGAGAAHTHTFADEQPSVQTWYMPQTYMFHAQSAAPSSPVGIAWNEIQTGDDANYIPSQFSQSITVAEGDNINLQIKPAGDANTYALSNIPTGLAYNSVSGYLQGTAPEVTGDNVANPSDEYVISVTKANAYGSSVGSLTLTVTNEDAPAATVLTPWVKALKFSGGSEYVKQVTQSTASNALRMNGLSQLASANTDSSKTSSDTYSRPWATAIVFQTPNNTTNQHIWNSGEGAATGDDNIYLRMTGANGELYFGWGRDGVGYNEYHLGNYGGSYNQSTGQWWGIYISHDGTRLNSADATAANLVNAFDIRLMGTNDSVPVFSNLYDVGSNVNNWVSTGVRMDRTIGGDFTIGGRGSNRSFHGRVASMVVTTLRKGVTKPTDAEIKLMLTDPIKWEDDYKDGVSARYGSSGSNFTYGPSNSNSKYATQIWLMGDGTSDSFANGIRNHVDTTDQNYVKLQLNSMQANDFETVNISGLS